MELEGVEWERHECSRQREDLEARESMEHLTNSRTVRKVSMRTIGNIKGWPSECKW